jgi:hypothetical protein
MSNEIAPGGTEWTNDDLIELSEPGGCTPVTPRALEQSGALLFKRAVKWRRCLGVSTVPAVGRETNRTHTNHDVCLPSMCNLYSITTNQAAIIGLFRVLNRYVGNLPPMPGVFPDYPAPVVRNSGAEREMVLLRWGMPPPPGTGGPPVTNIRNTSSPHWRMWLKPENRCLVPANSFAEYAPEPNPETKKKDVVWFAQRGPAASRVNRRGDTAESVVPQGVARLQNMN